MHRFIVLSLSSAVLVLVACSEKPGDRSLESNSHAVGDEQFSGVPFSTAEQSAALDLVNNAPVQVLDVDAGLTSTAAAKIVAARPIASMAALDAVPYVGPSALQSIKAYLPNWTGQSDPDAELLDFVNHPSVTVEELDKIQYIGPAQAQGIIQYRELDPIDSVDELLSASASAGASPLADHQLESLRGYAASWKPPEEGGGTYAPGTWCGVTFSGYEVGVVMDIVNHASLEVLDDEVGIVSTAARNIVDNRPIDSMDALDAVPYVATQAFQRLKAWIPNWTPPSSPDGGQPEPEPDEPQVVSGVSFSAAEATAVLEIANSASSAQLDDEAGLDTRAASQIVAARPIADLPALDAVPYVGATALEQLKAFIPSWQQGGQPEPPPAGGGTYDGVAFSAAEEATALEIANLASATQLTEGGIGSSPRKILLEQRPWANLAAVAAYSGIGAGTMSALKAMVPGWQGPVSNPVQVTVQQLADEAAAHGSASPYYNQLVQVARGIISSVPSTSSAGNTTFMIADPAAGNVQQLKVYSAATAEQSLAFASIFDDVQLVGVFDQYNNVFQIKLSDPQAHRISQNTSGLAYADYKTVQAAWHSTAANPEGVVRVVSSFDYTYMVPLPIFLGHPMFGSSPPGPPQDSGNEQDHAWNAASQQALDTWLASQ
ncbi:MAG: helix-hairpin-helix domain-containing protein [Deltaproteobacteria bacterium]|nr:helix-hairpin-helix domain-containing protein [Deltaproteobacteria bacterium]